MIAHGHLIYLNEVPVKVLEFLKRRFSRWVRDTVSEKCLKFGRWWVVRMIRDVKEKSRVACCFRSLLLLGLLFVGALQIGLGVCNCLLKEGEQLFVDMASVDEAVEEVQKMFLLLILFRTESEDTKDLTHHETGEDSWRVSREGRDVKKERHRLLK